MRGTHVQDDRKAQKMWELSEKLCGIKAKAPAAKETAAAA